MGRTGVFRGEVSGRPTLVDNAGGLTMENTPMDGRPIETLEARLERHIQASGECMLPYFRYSHLKDTRMREASSGFAKLAIEVVTEFPASAERTAGLRKLLEA